MSVDGLLHFALGEIVGVLSYDSDWGSPPDFVVGRASRREHVCVCQAEAGTRPLCASRIITAQRTACNTVVAPLYQIDAVVSF